MVTLGAPQVGYPFVNTGEDMSATFGILVGGGPAPGINGVIGAAATAALQGGARVLGIRDGFKWLMEGSDGAAIKDQADQAANGDEPAPSAEEDAGAPGTDDELTPEEPAEAAPEDDGGAPAAGDADAHADADTDTDPDSDADADAGADAETDTDTDRR